MSSIFRHATKETLEEIAEEMRVRQTEQFVLLFSMGSQFDHLIVQTLAKLGAYCVVADPGSVTAEDVKKAAPAGLVLSGGPAFVDSDPPPFDKKIFDLGIPTLGVCLGFQMWAYHIGAKVVPGTKREFGVHTFTLTTADKLFEGVPEKSLVLQSHGDAIQPYEKIIILGFTDNAPVAAGNYKHLWGVQFHPEVTDTVQGMKIYDNFLNICGITKRFPAQSIAKQKMAQLKTELDGKKVLIALSGGSDSSVVAYLLKGSGAKLKGVYIRGIDRPDDEAYVKKYFGSQNWIELEIVDATDGFLEALRGQSEMREKRIAMRGIYKEVLENKVSEFGADFIAQGTLYTDVRESGHGNETGARTAEIKIHHNVKLGFSVPEVSPLETEVKDSARAIGRELGVPEDLLVRHPFPGPGLIVRIEGEVTAENLKVARMCDGIYIEELRKTDLYNSVWQAGATLTRSVHTESKGDGAGIGQVLALWAVWSVNGFTTRFAQLPYDFLDKVSRRITNEVREIGAVVYRISDKPPSTIEWG